MNPIEFRLKVLCHASTAYAIAHPTQPTAQSVQLASQLAEQCVHEAARLGLFGQLQAPPSAVAEQQPTQPIMPPPMQGFAQEQGGVAPQQAPTSQIAAPQQAAAQVPMQPLPQSQAPQMTVHPSTAPIPQMPIVAASIAGAVAQMPMQPQVPQGQQVGAPAAPSAMTPMQVAPMGSSFQPLGPNGPTIPLPPQQYIPPTTQPAAQEGGQPVHTGGFQAPPPPMGGTNTVVQAPMPQNFSALGSIGVQEKVEQRPMATDTVVTPGNQAVLQGGGIAQVVQEKITH